MRTKINLVLLSLCAVLLFGMKVSAQTDSEPKEALVKVYYFHVNKRCATCKAIESEAQQDVKELFGSKVSFVSYNLDQPDGEAKGKELGINSQALLVVKGKKKINLTNEGFLYARTDPGKFKKVIEEKIKSLL
ncbi:hypothetical protein INQ51_09265 [Maribellus sp. CM-23]|uniref:nitrophenyl compound nitroreductase subunit ArsF family protein n=1 Tax=Maribellus sp. CM-23 TaxID=2781026 RepID=UPI001F39EEA6|nr:nitrophenyl compound nitroreductase subunit ArsF family protein [Maribellus sp. CM-23]MCE4564499.1 hypothetical protein [Maribellus sp. CM-23]